MKLHVTILVLSTILANHIVNSEQSLQPDHVEDLTDTCQGEGCSNEEEMHRDETLKYLSDQELHPHEETMDETTFHDWTEADIKELLDEIKQHRLTKEEVRRFVADLRHFAARRQETVDDQLYESDADIYELPPLVRVDPGQVGDEVEVELQDGVFYKRITRSVSPPVFEIPNFLTPEECDKVMDCALKNGLNISNLFGADIHEELAEGKNQSDVTRISEQTFLEQADIDGEFLDSLQSRISRLSHLDIELIKRSEAIQVVKYVPGGHYHAHLDSTDSDEEYRQPCCFQTNCKNKEQTPEWTECCKICRFMTVLYYLNDVEEGGETAFPFADISDTLMEEKMDDNAEEDWFNLSYNCHNSSLVVKPKRGTAIMWYNHFVDDQTGYLAEADLRSYHGGCDLIKGSKWIANNWIAGCSYEDRFIPSIYYKPPPVP